MYSSYILQKENVNITFQKLIQIHSIMQDFSTTSAI